MRSRLAVLLTLVGALLMGVAGPTRAQEVFVLRADRVYDGRSMHEGWSVLVVDGLIAAAGASLTIPSGAVEIPLSGLTLLPGLI